jgi:DtxR family transcriptional regulator, Mn-dependent transcriptional regulator
VEHLSIAMQKYLETVFDLSECSGNVAPVGVRVSDIALRLGVSKASVNNAINVLARDGYVTNERYQEIFLTPGGRTTAILLESKHRIIRALFADVIGIPEETANEDACAIEHIISPESVQKINEYLLGRGIRILDSDM